MEPEFFGESGVRAEPGFEILVGGLPVLPVDGGAVNGAGIGAEVINI